MTMQLDKVIETPVVVEETLLTITPDALDQLKDILNEENQPGLGLRIFVQGSEAAMGLDDTMRDGDIVMNFDGTQVMVDPDSAPYLAGAIISFQNSLMGRGFVIENANLPERSEGGCCGGSCGCGH